MRRFTLASYKMITVDYNQFDKQTEVFFPLQYTPSKFSIKTNEFVWLLMWIYFLWKTNTSKWKISVNFVNNYVDA